MVNNKSVNSLEIQKNASVQLGFGASGGVARMTLCAEQHV